MTGNKGRIVITPLREKEATTPPPAAPEEPKKRGRGRPRANAPQPPPPTPPPTPVLDGSDVYLVETEEHAVVITTPSGTTWRLHQHITRDTMDLLFDYDDEDFNLTLESYDAKSKDYVTLMKRHANLAVNETAFAMARILSFYVPA